MMLMFTGLGAPATAEDKNALSANIFPFVDLQMKRRFTACTKRNFFWYFLKTNGKMFLFSSFRCWLGSCGTRLCCLASCMLHFL